MSGGGGRALLSAERQRSLKNCLFPTRKTKGELLPKNYIHQRCPFVRYFKTKICAQFRDFYQQGTLLASERRILGLPASFEVPLLLYLQMGWHNQPIDGPCLVSPAFVPSPTTGLEAEVELPATWGQLLRKLSDVWRFELRAELLPSGMPMLSALGFKGWGHLYSVTFVMGLTDLSCGMVGPGDQTDMAHLPSFFTLESLHVSETHQEQQTHLDQGQLSHTLYWSPTGHWTDLP